MTECTGFAAALSADCDACDAAGNAYRPVSFSIEPGDADALHALCAERSIAVYDEIVRQLAEWIACRADQPGSVTATDIKSAIQAERDAVGGDLTCFGQWFYYPWLAAVVHVLPRAAFDVVRSNRNRDKITIEEQRRLRSARIGVVGLSVGHSIAMVLAQEGLCGHLRIADFDVLELSNLNRLRTTVLDLGLAKSTIAARRLSEIDPYLDVDVFPDGIDEANVDTFLMGRVPSGLPNGGAVDQQLDVLVEECDSLDVKLLLRERARERRIPVIMDTNDRGLLDVERFDNEPSRPILHGLLGDCDWRRARDYNANQRMVLFDRFFDGRHHMSDRLQQSLDKLGTELLGFPQLSSDVHLGAALVAHVVRRVLLGGIQKSGRHRIDLRALIPD